MSQVSTNAHNYAGQPAAKLAVWRRRWVQVTGASMVAFVLGLGVSGSPSTENMMSLKKAHTLASQAADQARDEAATEARENVMDSPEVLAALDQEREQAEARVSDAQAQASKAAAKAERQAKLLASARTQIRTLKQQKASAVAAAQSAKRAAQTARESAAAEAPTPAAASGTDPRFNYCYEANDAGYGPYFQGQDPEYDWYDDRDNDGEVCE